MDRDNEVNRILGAFKLNPMEQLGLRFDASEDEIKRQYRKTSLLVHPDKCKHPRAQDAFEVLGHANKQLQEPDKLKELMYVLNLARGAAHAFYITIWELGAPACCAHDRGMCSRHARQTNRVRGRTLLLCLHVSIRD